jgi:hypothetical protein
MESSNKKIVIWSAVIVCILLIVGVIWFTWLHGKLFGVMQQTAASSSPVLAVASSTPVPIVTNIAAPALPEGFPSSTPFFQQTEVLENFNADYGYKIEATQKYRSYDTMQQALAGYQSYFASTGWQLQQPIVSSSSITLNGRNGPSSTLFIFIAPDALASNRLVDITVSFATLR